MTPTTLLLVCVLFLYLTPLRLGTLAAAVECGRLIVTYDAQKDESRVQLRPLMVEGAFKISREETLMGENALPNDQHGVALTALYSYQGNTPSKPQAIIIVVESESTSPRYENDRRLSLNIDGKLLDLGESERGVTLTNMGLTREDLSARISSEEFLRFAGAKKAKLILGPRTFTLTRCHIEALRKFARGIPA